MRIAYICADAGIPVFGCKGSSVHVREFLRCLVKQGHSVSVFTSNVGGDPTSSFQSVTFYSLPELPRERSQRELAAIGSNSILRSALKESGRFDLIYERYSLWSFAGMEFSQREKIPGILEVNAPLVEEQAQYRTLIHRDAANEIARRNFESAAAIVAISHEVAKWIEGFTETPAKIHVIPNGVDPARFSFSQQATNASRDPDLFRIGFVGSLKPWHGLPVLIDAFAELFQQDETWRLSIIGDGPGRKELNELVARNGLDRAVEFTGAVDSEDVPALLASFDVAVCPSSGAPDYYFSPLKLFEYMAAALPIAASNIGQVAEIIRHENNGLLCAPGDARALAEALQRLRSDREFAKRLGSAAREDALKNHTWDAKVNEIFRVLEV